MIQHRLAAILFADVAGYTRLMDLYETDTHPRLMTLGDSVVEPTVATAGGQVVKHTGDGFLARFDSVNRAIAAAIAIQEEVQRREAGQAAERRIGYRMGLHTGDIVVEARDVYGAGVNLAARLQEIGEPGSVMISGAVHEQMGGNLKLPVLDLGYRRLKNITNAVRVYKIVVSSGEAAAAAPARDPPPRGRPSLAVLPFIEHGASGEDTYFGDCLVEDIVGALASLPDISVISRTSTLKYRENPPNIRAIGSELGVRYVFSGSVHRRDQRLRLSAELADAETLTVIAGDRVEGDMADLFGLQDRLVSQVVQTIVPNIRDAELQRIRRKRPENFDAYDYTLRGLDLLYRLDRDAFERARQMFEQAIGLDDNYAAPHAFSALWHSARLNQGWSPDPEADRAAVDQFAAAALQRDPLDVWALALSGQLRALLFRDFDTAFDLLGRALRASPSSAFAYARSSPVFSYVGDSAQARRRATEAIRLSPLDPHIFFAYGVVGLASYTEGDYDAAITYGRRSYAENPRYTANLRFLAASLAAGGRLEEARGIGDTLLRLEPGFRARVFSEKYAYRERERRDRLAEHLILAGLPE